MIQDRVQSFENEQLITAKNIFNGEPWLKYVIGGQVIHYIHPAVWKREGYTLEQVLQINNISDWLYKRFIELEYNKKNLSKYTCFCTRTQLVSALIMLGYKPVYLLDYKSRVIWFVVDRYYY